MVIAVGELKECLCTLEDPEARNSTDCLETKNLLEDRVASHTRMGNFRAARKWGSDMDVRLWGTLPEELLDRVLACLPVHSLFRSRAVCKRWNSLVFTPDFLELRAELARAGLGQHGSFFLMFPSYRENLECSAYYPGSGKWQSLPSLSFLPARVKTIRQGAGGLLLVLDNRTWVFHVCNPFTGRWREIPRLAHTGKEFQTASAMIVHKEGYKIIAAGSPHTQVYDSVSESWKIKAGYPSHVEVLMFRRTVCQGLLYIVAVQDQAPHRFGLVSYDVEGNGGWLEIEDKLPAGYVNGHVVECGEFVAMVAHVCTDIRGHSTTTSLHVFKLDPISKTWTELSKLPERLFKEFMRERGLCGYSCVGVDGNVFVTCSTGVRVLVFNTLQSSWQWVENCPLTVNEGEYPGVHAGYCFQPSLTACA